MKHFVPTWLPAEGSGVRAFLNVIDAAVPGWFAPDEPIHVARAPGRIDLLGGIADYSGSLVLPMPIAEAAIVAVQERDDDELHVFSPSPDGSRNPHVSVRLSDLGLPDAPVDYARARAAFAGSPKDRWAAYLLGCVLVLARERQVVFDAGLALMLRSDVPEGCGVSSSAAIEVAAMRAIAALRGHALDDRDLALLCQKVEQEVAGVPCGVMDQMAAVFGESGKVLALRCQPCELEGTVPLPPELEVVGLDSGVRRSVGNAAYATARAGAFIAYRMLADLRGLPVQGEGAALAIDDPDWRGHLANCPPDEWRARWARRLPDRIEGADFTVGYGGTLDPRSRIEPDRSYPVLAPAGHAIAENARAERFRALLQYPPSPAAFGELGDLMFASHAGYAACGLGDPTADWIVEQVRQGRARGNGLWGARMTGGGLGGTVAILGERTKVWLETLRIKRDLIARSGGTPAVLRWSSDGARAFGVLRLDPRT